MRTALILAGGFGTRLAPITTTLSKSLVPIDGQPALVTIIRQLEQAGIDRIVVFAGYLSWQVEFMLKELSKKYRGKLVVSVTPPGFSPAQRLIHESHLWDDASQVILIYCDNILKEADLVRHVRSHGVNRVLVQKRSPGNVIIEDTNSAKYSIVRSEARSYVELGYWCLSAETFRSYLVACMDMQKALQLFTENCQVQACEIEEYISISELKRYVKDRHVRRRKTVFLDRDGVLIHSIGRGKYVKHLEEIRFIDNNIRFFKTISKRFKLDFIVVTNQAGIEREMVTAKEVDLINQHITCNLLKLGVPIIAFYVCPHHWESGCYCRKPNPGMINSAIREFDLVQSECLFVGDRESDLESGKNANVDSFLLTERMSNQERKEVCTEIINCLIRKDV